MRRPAGLGAALWRGWRLEVSAGAWQVALFWDSGLFLQKIKNDVAQRICSPRNRVGTLSRTKICLKGRSMRIKFLGSCLALRVYCTRKRPNFVVKPGLARCVHVCIAFTYTVCVHTCHTRVHRMSAPHGSELHMCALCVPRVYMHTQCQHV